MHRIDVPHCTALAKQIEENKKIIIYCTSDRCNGIKQNNNSWMIKKCFMICPLKVYQAIKQWGIWCARRNSGAAGWSSTSWLNIIRVFCQQGKKQQLTTNDQENHSSLSHLSLRLAENSTCKHSKNPDMWAVYEKKFMNSLCVKLNRCVLASLGGKLFHMITGNYSTGLFGKSIKILKTTLSWSAMTHFMASRCSKFSHCSSAKEFCYSTHLNTPKHQIDTRPGATLNEFIVKYISATLVH